ncbi:hypothetical protein SAMN05216584_11040 [Selenomonas sp. WCT3]|nr:hypothetical protein SAMN05216584_11040 [Selenomonas ruminantium]
MSVNCYQVTGCFCVEYQTLSVYGRVFLCA